jgi:hypothetical protein
MRPRRKTTMSNSRNFVLFCGAIVLGLGALGGNKEKISSSVSPVTPVLSAEEATTKRVHDEEERKAREAAEAETCKMKWQACTDSRDLMNNYRWLYIAQADCKSSANDLAKYGDPKWGWLTFSKYRRDDDAPHTGIITLTDDGVMFQNAFGTYVKSRVVCVYDLKEKKVVIVKAKDRFE